VVHVSQLKWAVPNGDQVCTGLPNYMSSQIDVSPAAICDDKMVRRGNKLVPQVLIRWAGLPVQCTTWEPLYALVNQFPDSPAWGQAGARRGGNVTDMYLAKALEEKRRTDMRQKIRQAHLLTSGNHQATGQQRKRG
jgi:hypothetical protein